MSIREISVPRSDLPALYAQLDEDGYMFCSDYGRVESAGELWATGDSVEYLDDDGLEDDVNTQRAALGLPTLESHLIGTDTRYTFFKDPSELIWVTVREDK